LKYKNVAFVLGLCPNGLGAIRSLGRQGIPVVGLDYKPDGPGFYSRYANARLCPNPYLEPDKMCAYLMNLADTLNEKGVLFPTSDEFVLFVSRYRHKIRDRFLFALSSETAVESLLNKRWQYLKAEETGTPYPQTFYPESLDDIDRIKDEIEYPAIIKPCYTHLWKEKSFVTKGFIVNNESELTEKLELTFYHDVAVIIQSVVPGPVTNFYEVCSYLDMQHNPLCVFTKKKVRQYPCDMGVGSLMESVREDDLANSALKLFREIKYHGIGEVEFKRDPRNGQFKMIEINSRITLQNSLADYCGINLPLIQYQDLTGLTPVFRGDYTENKKWLWAEIDYEAFRCLNNNGELSWFSWLQSLVQCRSCAVFAYDDMRPFLNFLSKLIRRKLIVFNNLS